MVITEILQVNWIQIGGKLSSNISGFVNSEDSDQLASENLGVQDLHVFFHGNICSVIGYKLKRSVVNTDINTGLDKQKFSA